MKARSKHVSLMVLLALAGPGWSASRAFANGGDTCGSATVIGALPFNDTGTTVGFNNDYDQTCVNTSGARDVVYAYTPASNQYVTISLCPSAYDTFLYVYDTNCSSAVVACNDDACGTSGLRSQLTGVALTGGNTYFIVVDGFGTSEGSFTIDVTLDFLSDHPAGQESNAWTTITNTTDDELFAFTLEPAGGSATITQIVFSLSGIVGLTDADWSGVELVVDSNDDGTIDAGETTTVGGAGSVSQAAGTITFSTSFAVTGRTSYILRADFAPLSSGDAVTIDLLPGNLTGGSGTGTASTASHTLIDLSNGLLGLWKLNDNAGTSATDSSGNGRTGTLKSGPVWTGGIFSGALDFDEANDHLLVSDFLYGPDFTWSFWFKTEDNSGSFLQYILSHGAFNAQPSLNIYLIEGTSILRTVFRDSDDGSDTSVFDITERLVGTGWHLYTMTVAAGVGSKVFVDGVLRASDTTRGGDAFDPNTNIFFAARSDLDANRFYGGRLDDIRLYNRALSLAEVQQLAKGAGLRAHWKLDDGAGLTATDSAGSNHGTLTGVPAWVDGRLCGGLDFDGANDYVDMGDVLDMGDTDDFTISGWFNRATFTTDDTLVAKRTTSGTGSTTGYMVFISGTGDTLIFRADDGVDLFTMTSSTTFLSTGWNHFAVVWDQSSASASKIYVNGLDDNAAKTGTITSIGSLNNGDPIRIGALSDGGGGGKFDGWIDDVRLYNQVLSAAEIQALAAPYQVIDLGSQTGTSSVGTTLNESEQVVGFDTNVTTGSSSAWRSRFCLFTTIPLLSGGSVNEALGINATGNVVGWSDSTGGIRKAFLWTSGGGTTDLGLLAGRTDSEAIAVNSNDEVVGTALDFSVPPANHVAFFNLPVANYGLTAGMNNLGTLGGTLSVAMDVNDSGQVVGGAEDSTSAMKPFIWLPSTAFGLPAGMNSLGTLGGANSLALHRAQAINASGEVVGRSYTAAGKGHGFHWKSGTMTDMGTLTGGDSSWAFDINDGGTAVGAANVSGGDYHAFLWDGTTMTDLNNLIDSGSGWTLVRATGINNDREIVGWGTNSRNETRAFMLVQTCSTSTTAQSSGALLSQGLATTNRQGNLEETVTDDSGERLAQIVVNDAESEKAFTYAVTSAVWPNSDSSSALPKPPGPGNGTFAGFFADIAFNRTLTLVSPSMPGEFLLTMRMTFTNDQLYGLGVAASELQLHEFDPSRGRWTPAGANIGESPPSGILDQSGFEVFADDTIDYWVVRDTVGIFAVGRPAPHHEDEAMISQDEMTTEEGVRPEEERPSATESLSEQKLTRFDEVPANAPDEESAPPNADQGPQDLPIPQVLPPVCGLGLLPFSLVGLTLLFAIRTRRYGFLR